jgi:hypothetical protein
MKRIDCKRIEEILPLYLEGSLSEEEAREVEKHLASCKRCYTSYEEWRRCFSALQNVPRLQAPSHIWVRVKQELSQRRERTISWLPAFATLLGVSLVILFIFFNLYSQRKFLPPPLSQQPHLQVNLPSPTPPGIAKAVPAVPKIAKTIPKPKVKKEIVLAKRPLTFTPSSRGVLAPSKLKEAIVEEKIAERLEMALLSAQQAETNLERAFQILRGRNLSMKGGDNL